MADRTAHVTWSGSLMEGAGTITSVGSGAFGPLDVTWASRDRPHPAAAALPWLLLALTLAAQIAYPLVDGARLHQVTFAVVVLGAATCAVHALVLARHEHAELTQLRRHLQTFTNLLDHAHAGVLVPDVPGPLGRRRHALAEIVHQRCKPHRAVVR